MSYLIIDDLEFCDRELLNKEHIRGGTTSNPPYGTWSSSSSSAYDADYAAGYAVDSNNRSVSAYLAPKVGGGVAGAVAGAVADGGTYTSTSANTGVY